MTDGILSPPPEWDGDTWTVGRWGEENAERGLRALGLPAISFSGTALTQAGIDLGAGTRRPDLMMFCRSGHRLLEVKSAFASNAQRGNVTVKPVELDAYLACDEKIETVLVAGNDPDLTCFPLELVREGSELRVNQDGEEYLLFPWNRLKQRGKGIFLAELARELGHR